jgi:AbrB family looped-hinge helix DNA binding protein
MNITAIITSKGQVTIPKAIRDRLKARTVEFVMTSERIELRPVQSAAGSLAGYAEKYVPLEEARESVWGNNDPK